ncbi:unnamed protein product [Pylaiella littoralis]
MGDMGMGGMGPGMGGGGGGEEEDERQFYSAENIAHNKKVLEYCRTSLCAVGGIVSGILGLTGLIGLFSYLVLYVVVSLSLVAKMGTTDVSLYTSGKAKLAMFAFSGVGNYALTYILFWTLAYTLVYIY